MHTGRLTAAGLEWSDGDVWKRPSHLCDDELEPPASQLEPMQEPPADEFADTDPPPRVLPTATSASSGTIRLAPHKSSHPPLPPAPPPRYFSHSLPSGLRPQATLRLPRQQSSTKKQPKVVVPPPARPPQPEALPSFDSDTDAGAGLSSGWCTVEDCALCRAQKSAAPRHATPLHAGGMFRTLEDPTTEAKASKVGKSHSTHQPPIAGCPAWSRKVESPPRKKSLTCAVM